MKSGPGLSQRTTQRLALSAGLLTSIQILRADASGLSRYLEEQSADNPHLVLDRRGGSDWLPRWTDAFARSGGQGGDAVDQIAGPGTSLLAHVTEAIRALRLSPSDLRIAEALADALEPSGWLGRPVAAVATELRVPAEAVEAVLTRLQTIEPVGLFARSLAECLSLQAREAGFLTPLMAGILDRLDLVAAGERARIAREMDVGEDQVLAAIRSLRGLDPKPGSQFAAFAAPVREPDLVVTRDAAGGWAVALNRSALPDVRLADAAVKVGRDGKRSAARVLVRLVEGRNATLLRVGTAILMRQTGALEAGLSALRPMSMSDIATEVALAGSTVSRVVAGASVDTPGGTWWLRDLFSRAPAEGAAAAGALRARIGAILAAEDPARPLSDTALTETLAAEGHALSRRTVAKYREMIGAAPAHRRRRKPVRPVRPAPVRRLRPDDDD